MIWKIGCARNCGQAGYVDSHPWNDKPKEIFLWIQETVWIGEMREANRVGFFVCACHIEPQ